MLSDPESPGDGTPPSGDDDGGRLSPVAPPGYRAGFVALVGRPNVGKSTLLNAMLDQKLSIVTSTPQTTRQRILGVKSRDTYQLVFLDTPGMLEPRYELQRRMLEQALAAIGDADVILALIEARTPLRRRELELIEEIAGGAGETPVLAVLNKIDRVGKPELLPMIATLGAIGRLAEVVPVSALEADGIPELEAVIAGYLPPSPPYFPTDTLSDQPERFFVAELIREKVFRRYGDEIPYSTAVMIAAFEEREGRKVHIRAEIVVERASQKGILIGQGGGALKRVGSEARVEIEQLLGRPVYLELWARVRPRWRSDPRFLRELGL